MQVKDVMRQCDRSATLATPISEIARMMARNQVSAIPVAENGNIYGVVTDWDISCGAIMHGEDLALTMAKDVMTAGAVSCQDVTDVRDAVQLMERKKVRCLPVVNDGNRPVGVVSLVDVSRVVLKSHGLIETAS